MDNLSLETVRLDSETKNQFLTLKRRTGIENWNVLARWAFCLSISDPTPIRKTQGTGTGAIEMSWKTFAGEYDAIYWALLLRRCEEEKTELSRDAISEALRSHISRGAARMAGNRQMKGISDFISMGTQTSYKSEHTGV